MYQSIVVALDGSADAEKILPYVEALARSFRSEVLLVGATASNEEFVAETASPSGLFAEPPVIVDPGPIVSQVRHDASEYLSKVADELRTRGIGARYQRAKGPPADAILAVAESADADLIAMTTSARGGVSRLIFGSVADDVLRRTPCPLLLVRLVDEAEVTPIVDVVQTTPDIGQQLVPAV